MKRNAEKAYLHAVDGDFELCTSIAVLTQLARKLDEKFGWEKGEIEQLITSINNLATTFKTAPRPKVLSDDPDNRSLECALDANAEFVVTGDRHLLNLTMYKHIEIIKLSAFLGMRHQTPAA